MSATILTAAGAVSRGELRLREDFNLNPSMSTGALTTGIQNAMDSATSSWSSQRCFA